MVQYVGKVGFWVEFVVGSLGVARFWRNLTMLDSGGVMYCRWCGDDVAAGRSLLGYVSCLECGEREAREVKHCIVPMNKSNYVVVSDMSLLKQLNPKRSVA